LLLLLFHAAAADQLECIGSHGSRGGLGIVDKVIGEDVHDVPVSEQDCVVAGCSIR
jgi:hypothetical protein